MLFKGSGFQGWILNAASLYYPLVAIAIYLQTEAFLPSFLPSFRRIIYNTPILLEAT